MKLLFNAFVMCQSMFCAIPCPWKIWDEEARDKMLLFLPVVGLEIGILWALLAWGCELLCLSVPIAGVLLCVYPFLVTGYIHLDGYMDVTDAMKSWRDLERRREILKDSHVGSFAVINLCLLVLAQFALFVGADGDYRILAFIPAVSRCCSALAVKILKPMSTSQYASQKKFGSHVLVLCMMLVILLGTGFALCGKAGCAMLGCIAGYGMALRKGFKSLEGMNGDISGYALTIGELCAVFVYALI